LGIGLFLSQVPLAYMKKSSPGAIVVSKWSNKISPPPGIVVALFLQFIQTQQIKNVKTK